MSCTLKLVWYAVQSVGADMLCIMLSRAASTDWVAPLNMEKP